MKQTTWVEIVNCRLTGLGRISSCAPSITAWSNFLSKIAEYASMSGVLNQSRQPYPSTRRRRRLPVSRYNSLPRRPRRHLPSRSRSLFNIQCVMTRFLQPRCGHSCTLPHRWSHRPRRRRRPPSHRSFLPRLMPVSLSLPSAPGVAPARTLLPQFPRRQHQPRRPKPTHLGPQPAHRQEYRRGHNGARWSVKIYLQATLSSSFVVSTPKQEELFNFIQRQFTG